MSEGIYTISESIELFKLFALSLLNMFLTMIKSFHKLCYIFTIIMYQNFIIFNLIFKLKTRNDFNIHMYAKAKYIGCNRLLSTCTRYNT